MTEREMLKLAAVAYFGSDGFRWNAVLDLIEYIPEGESNYVSWRPHLDDGDAFRLSVQLEMVLEMNAVSCGASNTQSGSEWCYEAVADHSSARAATRRAILRAAVRA